MTRLINIEERLYVIVEKKLDESGEEVTPGWLPAKYYDQALDRAAAYFRWQGQLVNRGNGHLLVGLNQTRKIIAHPVEELPEGLKELSWTSR